MMAAVLPLISPEKGAQLGFMTQGLILVVSGVYVTVDKLPHWMQVIADDFAGDLRAARHPPRDPGRVQRLRSAGATSGRCS